MSAGLLLWGSHHSKIVRACAGTKSAPQDLLACLKEPLAPRASRRGLFFGLTKKKKEPLGFRPALKIDLRGRPDCPSGPSAGTRRLRFEPTIFPEIGRGKRMGKRRFQPMSGTRLDVCALGDRRGPGGRGDGARPLPSPRLLRREDLASRGNSVRAVAGDRLVWGGPQLEGRAPACPCFEQPTGSITRSVGISTQPITSGLHPVPFADRGQMVLLKAS